jgi:hypothetical protein
MIIATAQGLADAVVSILTLDPPPAEAEIDAVLQRMGAAFAATPAVMEDTRRLLHARFEIRMDLGETLKGSEEHTPWLAGRRGDIDPFYWNRYRQLLLRNGWPPLVTSTLDRATDDLLDLLGNPTGEGQWKRRGLVMGDVQSGKTATYAALMCKAADAGYRMIVLLTGTLENVRRQTQERLDEAFIGFDSRDFLAGGGAHRQKRHIGVGLIDGRRDGVVFTSRDHDFRKQAASALNISLSSVQEPVLVVTKKNKRVLDRLAAWLRAYNADRDGRIDMPLLLIDDEADNASVNTKQDPQQTTSINGAIRDMLGLFRRSSYVGFTATPFANIFIDPESTNEWVGDDLFPRDFIHVLKAPDNYVGMARMFGSAEVLADGEVAAAGGVVRTIEDADDWLAPGHKSTDDPGPLPESLRDALRAFLLSCSIRDLRKAGGGGIHRSMLVNVSHFTAVQNKVADALHLDLEDIRRAVRLHGSLPADVAVRRSDEIAALGRVFEDEFDDCEQSWDDVLAALHEAIAPVRVQAVNASTGAKSLDYTIADAPPGVRVVAVGGNTLSRGLTLEGLCVSYFLRRSRAYDTLLQMGRWFGYRSGYGDLCRLWMTDEAEGWYQHIAEATAELKSDFARMQRRKATPSEFGLRVRRHADTLLITARNKMASGLDIEVTRDVSLTGRGVESPRLFGDRGRNAANLALTERLFTGLRSQMGDPDDSPWGGALVWTGVPAAMIADYLDEFAIHPLNFAFQPDSIAEFLREGLEAGAAPAWTVAVPTVGKGEEHHLPSLERTVQTRLRHVKFNPSDGSLMVSGRSARVGGKADVRHGIARADLPEDVEAEGDIRALMSTPLLVTYLLRGEERGPATRDADGKLQKGDATPFREGMILPALALHFPGEPDPSRPERPIKYRLNRVAQRELFGFDDGGDPAADEDVDEDD